MREKLAQVKNHFVENKWVYISVGAVAGISAASFVAGRYSGVKVVTVTDVANVKLWSPTTTNITVSLEELSIPSKPIYCPQLKRAFNSISAASRELGINRADISNHLAGRRGPISDYTFELIDLA